jgi:hypothetical protein
MSANNSVDGKSRTYYSLDNTSFSSSANKTTFQPKLVGRESNGGGGGSVDNEMKESRKRTTQSLLEYLHQK